MKWGEGEGTEGGGRVDSAVALAGAAGSVSSLRELQPPGGSEGGTALRGQGLSSVEAAEGIQTAGSTGALYGLETGAMSSAPSAREPAAPQVPLAGRGRAENHSSALAEAQQRRRRGCSWGRGRALESCPPAPGQPQQLTL